MATARLASAAEPWFVRHDINPASTYSACAAVDVNLDGRLDIVSGGWWYEAPEWKRHFLRQVQMIRGRFDDYANLPLDVNRDGRVDLVSANYRSRSLYWVENPGVTDQPWPKHVIDVPGPMETGRLVDVDQDGQLDILPNGVQFAAWWELVQPQANGGSGPQWLRHDLPGEVAGHGIGFGDIDGDGRGDVVGPRGWLQAPADRRRGRWIWHAEYQLHRDGSIPILVHDVDLDGDNDLVWGRGHNIGLYWMEQVRDSSSARRWVLHAIDTSWSEAHSLLVADVDQDGQQELVAGKRYMGHDGKDPGEYDPLAIYWYDFDRSRRTWRRGVISEGGPVGFGLDPKAIDLDDDGDIDVLAAGRSGLFWLENLLEGQKRDSQPPPPRRSVIEDHTKLLLYPAHNGQTPQVHPVQSAADWALRRADILAGIEAAMGQLPDSSRRVPLDIETLGDTQMPMYARRKITYAAEPADRVPAYLLIPNQLAGPAPAMLCLHQTTGIGKDEPAGLGENSNLDYAHELAQRGYVCLVPDYPSFGDYDYDFRAANGDYASGSMKAIWNNIRAIDLLESLSEVDADRIGCIGHSLGGHNALFTAAFDQRLRVLVTSCGFTAFHDYYQGNLRGWTSDRYMPRIDKLYHNDPDQVPFDFHEVLAALAPRGVFVNAPLGDVNFDVGGVKKVMRAASEVYRLLGAEAKVKVLYPDAEHDFPIEVRQAAYGWLDQQLRR